MPLPAGIGWFSPFGRFVFLALHGDLPVHLLCGLAGNTPFLVGGGADTLPVGRFSGDQTAPLDQLLHQFSYELVSYFVTPVLIAQAADFKVFRNVSRNGVYNIEIAAFCSAFFQDIVRDLIPLCLQLCPVRFIAQILISHSSQLDKSGRFSLLTGALAEAGY